MNYPESFYDFSIRAKSYDRDEWLYGYYICCNNEHYIVPYPTKNIIEIDAENILLKATRIKESTICYYTFELDIDDNEIYEGDIIKTLVLPESPFREEIYAVVVSVRGDVYGLGAQEIDRDWFQYCEIVDTAYENPELYEIIKECSPYPTPREYVEELDY